MQSRAAGIAYVATTTFQRIRADGSVARWRQEDESAVQTKAEAVGMVQRTLNFWIPKAADDLVEQRGLKRVDAIKVARSMSRNGLRQMLDKPFSRRWGLTLEDFNFEVKDD